VLDTKEVLLSLHRSSIRTILDSIGPIPRP
jgi:hypothetical protein